ncbi:MAG TPA: hypothetical protein VFG43_01210 [Geminicoccaceae bacterium]|nr:hypothetical protein [Geminicoccaceae bacterium]
MVDTASRDQLFGLAEACRRSAEAISRAMLDVDDADWDEPLRAAHQERIDLYEICIRCLIDTGVSPAVIRDGLAAPHARVPADRAGTVRAVLGSEIELEAALRLALANPRWADHALGEALALYLLKSLAFRRQFVVLAEQVDEELVGSSAMGRWTAATPALAAAGAGG